MVHYGGEGTAARVEVLGPFTCSARKQRWTNAAAWLEFSLSCNPDLVLGMLLPTLRL